MMKYFKREYHDMINSGNDELRERGHELWDKALKAYGAYYEGVKAGLSKGFLTHYEKHHFHDYYMKEIRIFSINSTTTNLSIDLASRDDKNYLLTYKKVESFHIERPEPGIYHKHLEWGYDEFEKCEDGDWIHRIFCFNDGDIEIKFKSVNIKRKP